MINRLCSILLLLLCSFIVTIQADEVKVTMKSGSTITGELKSLVATDHVVIVVAGIETVIPMEEVASIEKSEVEQTNIQTERPTKLKYGEYHITDTKEYPDSFVLKIGDQDLTMILVRGGWFNMGYDGRFSRFWDTEPIHRVTLSSFYVSKQLLSQSIIDRLKNKKKPSGNKRPHSFDSRKVLEGIIEKINLYSGAPYRLLTEAEWEYTSLMPFANSFFGDKKRLEWCHDYRARFTSNEQFDPQGPIRGDNYVLRCFSPDNEKWKRIQNNEDYFGTRYARIAISADQIKQ